MFLGIEIGGTKLQVAVGRGDGSEFIDLERHAVSPDDGASGILDRIERTARGLLQKNEITRIGIGFGGPVDPASGSVVKSHQIDGWDQFPLAPWCQSTLGVATVLGNDCDLAALAEARFGAGRGHSSVFFVTVGTGVGGGLVVDGQLIGQGRPAIAEIGHLRPGLHNDRPEATVESIASGWGIAAAARSRATGEVSRPMETLRDISDPTSRDRLRMRMRDAAQADHEYIADLLQRCHGEVEQLTAKMVAQAAAEGNEVARQVLHQASQALGWAIAQVVTLLAPQVIVVGGGVSLMGRQLFFAPLYDEVQRYVFPPLSGSYTIEPAALGESVVVHGALALAAMDHQRHGQEG